MPTVLVYEYTCSSPVTGIDGHDALSAEGRAMLVSLATDLVAASKQTVVLWNDSLGEFPSSGANVVSTGPATHERLLLSRYSREVDWTIIIAPESGGILAERCRWVESAGGCLLGCSSSLVELLAHKHRTAEHLAAGGISSTRGQPWQPGDPPPALPCPVVVKPCDGAGSERTLLVEEPSDLKDLLANYESSARIEEYVPGVACSVSFLCGPGDCFPLLPAHQRIESALYTHQAKRGSYMRKIKYLGGRLPLPAHLSVRATQLASRAVQTLPIPMGYVGVDLVLGDREDRSRDFVIEINPRLTTSYVGLRAAARSNLAQAMLDVATGSFPSLSFNDKAIEFDADGTVRMGAES